MNEPLYIQICLYSSNSPKSLPVTSPATSMIGSLGKTSYKWIYSDHKKLHSIQKMVAHVQLAILINISSCVVPKDKDISMTSDEWSSFLLETRSPPCVEVRSPVTCRGKGGKQKCTSCISRSSPSVEVLHITFIIVQTPTVFLKTVVIMQAGLWMMSYCDLEAPLLKIGYCASWDNQPMILIEGMYIVITLSTSYPHLWLLFKQFVVMTPGPYIFNYLNICIV